MISKLLYVCFVALCVASIAACDKPQLSPKARSELLDALLRSMELRTPKCCQVDMPQLPIFSGNGDLLGYQPQACPVNYLVCCKAEINIAGTCINLATASMYLPVWQSLAASLGISLLEAIEQSGVLVG